MLPIRSYAAALLALLTLSCRFGGTDESPVQTGEPSEVKPGFNLLSPEQDIEIGRASVNQIEEQLPLVEKREVVSYVEELGARLAVNAPGPKFPYQFRVVNASDLNAFALPGGPIFINRGVIESAKSEGEVAGVLAHEIAHVALRHGTHNVSKAYLTRAGIGILGGILGGDMSAGTAAIINVLGGFGLNALFLKHSRAAETQADILGAQILARSGYDPRELIGFFKTLQQSEKQKTIGWLSDHPTPERRIERLEAEARALGSPGKSPRPATEQFAAVQARLRRMPDAKSFEELATLRTPEPVAREQRRVALAPVAAATAEMVRYSAPSGAFEVEHPANWKVYDGDGDGVTFAPENGVYEVAEGVEIVYGAIVNHYVPFGDGADAAVGTERPDITSATRDLAVQIQRGSPHLRVVAERPTSTNAMITTFRGVSPNSGVEEEVRLYTSELADRHLVFLLFVTPAEASAQYNATFDRMVLSLRGGPRH